MREFLCFTLAPQTRSETARAIGSRAAERPSAMHEGRGGSEDGAQRRVRGVRFAARLSEQFATALAICVLLLSACAHRERATHAPPLRDAQQLVVVTTAGWNANSGQLRTFTRDGS